MGLDHLWWAKAAVDRGKVHHGGQRVGRNIRTWFGAWSEPRHPRLGEIMHTATVDIHTADVHVVRPASDVPRSFVAAASR